MAWRPPGFERYTAGSVPSADPSDDTSPAGRSLNDPGLSDYAREAARAYEEILGDRRERDEYAEKNTDRKPNRFI